MRGFKGGDDVGEVGIVAKLVIHRLEGGQMRDWAS